MAVADNTLTKQETKILTLFKQGVKRSGIAKKLNISVRTYDFHMNNIKDKLGVVRTEDVLDKEKVWVLPEQRFFSILERSERVDIALKLLSKYVNLPGWEMDSLEQCVMDVEVLNETLHDMQSANADALQCVETYELNENSPFYVIEKGLTDEK